MSLAKQVEDLIAQRGSIQQTDPELRRLLDLLHQLQQQGIVKKPGYDLPPRDTLGRFVVTQSTRSDR